MELSIYCRVCMDSTFLEYIDLDTPLNDVTYLECFNYCTKLDVVLQDGLPKTICLSCGKSLKIAYEFIKKAQETDSFLRDNVVLTQDGSKPQNEIKNELIGFVEPNDEEAIYTREINSSDVVENKYSDNVYHNVTPICVFDGEATQEQNFNNDINTKDSDDVEVHNISQNDLNDVIVKQNENIALESNSSDRAVVDSKQEYTTLKPSKCKKCIRCYLKSQENFNDCKDLCVCNLCGEVFEDKEHLTLHENLDHNDNAVGLCITCGKSFSDKICLQKHVAKEHGFQFEIVNDTGKHKTSGSLPLALENYTNPKLFQRNSPKVYKKKQNISLKDVTYIKSKNALSDEILTERLCNRCDFSTKDTLLWIRHKNLHRQKKHLCAYCPKSFSTISSLSAHEDYVHGNKKNAPQCKICDKKFISKYLLKRHNASAHSEERPFECKQCPKTFKFISNLTMHQKRHNPDKRIECPHCDKTFVMKTDFRVHLRTHTGELPYECHLCGQKFRIKVRLTYHLKRHEGVLYKCQECPEEFCSMAMLRYHKFTHIGYPYACEICNKGYCKKTNFQSHMNKTHNLVMTEEDLKKHYLKNSYKIYRPNLQKTATQKIEEMSVK